MTNEQIEVTQQLSQDITKLVSDFTRKTGIVVAGAIIANSHRNIPEGQQGFFYEIHLYMIGETEVMA